MHLASAQQGGPIPGCEQCQRGFDAYTYGMGVVIKGNWLLQDPLVNGYSALEAYLPSQRIAISPVGHHRGVIVADRKSVV